jgi:hypothetical protein
MPRFKTFDAPDKAFSEDSAGFAAYETAGRRLGPLLDRADSDLRRAGQAGINAAEAGVRTARDDLGLAESNVRLSEAQASQQRASDRQSVTDRTWPFDMAALSQQGSGSSRGGRGGGGGMRLAGSVNPEIDNRTGGYSNDSPSRGDPGRSSRGAAALGRLAAGHAQSAPYAAQQTFDSNGNLIYDSRRPNAFRQPTEYLDHGQLVRPGQRGPGDVNGERAANEWAYGRGGPASQGPIDTSTGQPVGQDYGGGGDPGARDTYAGPEGNISVPPGYDSSSQDYGGGGDSGGWFNGVSNWFSGSNSSSSGGDYGGGSDDFGEE